MYIFTTLLFVLDIELILLILHLKQFMPILYIDVIYIYIKILYIRSNLHLIYIDQFVFISK